MRDEIASVVSYVGVVPIADVISPWGTVNNYSTVDLLAKYGLGDLILKRPRIILEA